MRSEGVTALNQTPSAFRQLSRAAELATARSSWTCRTGWSRIAASDWWFSDHNNLAVNVEVDRDPESGRWQLSVRGRADGGP